MDLKGFIMKKLRLKFLLAIAIIALIAAFASGYIIRGFQDKSGSSGGEQKKQAASEKQQWWTCSMHPQIRQPKPGKCPICFMDLIPMETEAGDTGSREISFSEDALKLMEIETAAVERKFVDSEVRLTGKVAYDETRLKHITAWVPGRIDRLYVDFTGTQVIKGDHMVYLYSPELISSQTELLEASRAVESLTENTSALIKNSTRATLEAARDKLRLLGLTDEQIEQIEQSGQATDHITINAPIGGIVIEKHLTEGQYVQTGAKIYTIADLSELWVQLDAYESDLMWIRYGQEVEFTTEAYPGDIFTGRVSFLSPTVDPETRTIKVRLNVSNRRGKLKPDMFVRAVVRSKIAMGGKVMDADMAGKWICPMHPSVIKDSFGKCDICQMDLVTTESLGYVTDAVPEQAPLVIPVSAALVTGKRAVVYVRLDDPNKPTFEGREVVLGPRATDYYIVKEGLNEGEVVVSKGNFKIDSALQIQAKPSMMNPEGSLPMTEHQH